MPPSADHSAVSANRITGEWSALAGIADILQEKFGGEAVIGEDERLLMPLDKLRRDAARLTEITTADSELPIHDRRIVEDEIFLAARRSVAVHQLEGRFSQCLGQFLGIRDG